MTLDEFARTCEQSPALRGLWKKLSDAAHRLIRKQLQVSFGKMVNGELKRLERELALVRRSLEQACRDVGINYPDLSAKSFSDWVLRY